MTVISPDLLPFRNFNPARMNSVGFSPHDITDVTFAFKVDPKEVVLGENTKPVNVNIKSTVPIVCQDGTENCHVQLEVGQSGAKDSFVDYCTLK